jgi:hypothetical protein
MYIELLIFGVLLVVVAFTLIALEVHKKYKIWRYKPENDKSRRAEESRGFRELDVPRPLLSRTRTILSPTDVSPTREIDQSSRENIKDNRRVGRKFRIVFKR